MEDSETCPDNIDDIEMYPPIEIPYMTICFEYCDNNGWSAFNKSYSCETAPTQQTYINKVNFLIKGANALLARIISNHPNKNIICSGYEMIGIVDSQDNAPWLCDKLDPIIDFVTQLNCEL